MQNTLRSALPDLILLRRKFATRGIAGKGGDEAQACTRASGSTELKLGADRHCSSVAGRRTGARHEA